MCIQKSAIREADGMRKVQGTQFPAGVWGSASSIHLKGEDSMQYTAAMKQMPMQGLFSFFLFRRHF